MKNKRIKIIVMIVAVALVISTGGFIIQRYTAASALNEAREAAAQYLPAAASLQKQVKDDDEYYFQYFDAAANETFDLYVDRKDYTQIKLQSRVDNVSGSEQVAYTRDEIINLVKENYPAAEIQSVTLNEGRSGYVYEIAFSGDTVRGQLSINPVTGVIFERSLRFGRPMLIVNLSGDDTDDDYVVPVNKSYISLEEARLLALEKVPGASIKEMEYDEDNGRLTIEIEMHKDETEYEIKIDAQTGEVLKLESDDRSKNDDVETDVTISATQTTESSRPTEETTEKPRETTRETTEKPKDSEPTPTTTASGPQLIGTEKVKQIVLGKAPGATIVELELERDDGRVYYEGEAVDGRYEYEFEIDAYTGAVIEWEKDDKDDDDYSNRESYIGTEAVKKIVLGYVSGATIGEIDLDEDDGRYYYEVEAYKDGIENEFEIDAYTGELIEWEQDD